MVTYYVLTFAISWGAMLLVIGGPGGIPANREQSETLMPLVVLALIAGPSVTGLALTGLYSGRSGLRELGSRLLRWRLDKLAVDRLHQGSPAAAAVSAASSASLSVFSSR